MHLLLLHLNLEGWLECDCFPSEGNDPVTHPGRAHTAACLLDLRPYVISYCTDSAVREECLIMLSSLLSYRTGGAGFETF